MSEISLLIKEASPIIFNIVNKYITYCSSDPNFNKFIYDIVYPYFIKIKNLEYSYKNKYKLTKQNRYLLKIISRFPKTVFNDIVNIHYIKSIFPSHYCSKKLIFKVDDLLKILHLAEDLKKDLIKWKYFICSKSCNKINIEKEINNIEDFIIKISKEIYK